MKLSLANYKYQRAFQNQVKTRYAHASAFDRKFLFKIESVPLRKKRGDTGKFDEIKDPPELEGHTVDGRLAVVFSQHDLSCAMESSTVSQCDGYIRDDAEKIGINVLLYRLRVE